MSEQTNIAWCDSTLNFWSGCTKVSDGCKNCYAEKLSNNKFFGGGNTIGKWGKDAPRKLHESAFTMALRLNKKPWICDGCGRARAVKETTCEWCSKPHPEFGFDESPNCHRRRIFSLSLGDWLDPEVPIEWLARMLDMIRQCDEVIWILCTKRPELFFNRMEAAMRWVEDNGGAIETHRFILDWAFPMLDDGIYSPPPPPKQVWLLISVENQNCADERIPELLKIPAVVRGLSCEPLIGLVVLPVIPGSGVPNGFEPEIKGIDWLIIGGESGKNARPCNVDWVRSLVNQGNAAGVATFVKQLGAKVICRNDFGFDGDSGEFPMDTRIAEHIHDTGYQGAPVSVLLRDLKGGDISEFPDDLKIREFPEPKTQPIK